MITTATAAADRLAAILAQIDQFAADLNGIEDPYLFFDLATQVSTIRQPLLTGIQIAEGAAQQAAAEAARAWMAAARQSERHACGAY